MDRKTINVAKAQIGFIDVIVEPAFDGLSILLPNIERSLLRNCKDNKVKWENLIEQYQETLNKMNRQSNPLTPPLEEIVSDEESNKS
jgi:hypothetical protein